MSTGFKKPQRHLIISTFPPKHCGIGTYAQEEMLERKRLGHIVYSQSFGDGSLANYHFKNWEFKGLVKACLFALLAPFDQIHMHFSTGLIWPRVTRAGKAVLSVTFLQYLWIIVLGLRHGRRFTMTVHEVVTGHSHKKKVWLADGIAFACVRNIQVHTEEERKKFLATFRWFVPPWRVKVVDHQRYMSPKFVGSKAEARYRLGLPDDQIIFICIGFIQHHKGFDQVVEAMRDVQDPRRHLYVVGSIRLETPEYMDYRDKLRTQIATVSGATLVEEYINDVAFDLWIAAADRVVLPYREIWSSSVGARARLLKTPMIIRRHPNLISQFDDVKDSLTTYESHQELFDLLGGLAAKPHTPLRSVPLTAHDSPRFIANRIFRDKKFLFVMPAFGEEVRGGAEGFVYQFAKALVMRGANVEVWTSDSTKVVARNHLLKDKDDSHLLMKVRRFPANVRAERLFNRVHRYMNMDGRCGYLMRKVWVATNLHGYGMEEALKSEAHRFDVIHLFHYLLGSAHRMSGMYPQKMILHPFVHEEAPARNPVMRHLFAGVRGVTCSTDAEWAASYKSGQCGLLPSLFKPIGIGVEEALVAPAPVPSLVPFADCGYIVFAGRMIAEKNLPLLLDWHGELLRADPQAPALVFMGEGPFVNDQRLKAHAKFHYLGFVDAGQKRQVLQQALGLVQLSMFESFSIVMMEAWLEGVPCIAHSECYATRIHIDQSGGGFAVATATEYATAVRKLANDPQLVIELGAKGRDYVKQTYTWDSVTTRYALGVADIMEWRLDGLRTIDEMNGVVSEKILPAPALERQALLGEDYYVGIETAGRDGAAPPESWAFYAQFCRDKYPADRNVLDIGAGRGLFLDYLRGELPNNHYFGIEPDKASFVAMRQRGVAAACMDVEEFAQVIEPATFDFAVMMHVIEHVDAVDQPVLLAYVKRLLRPGGFLMVELPNGWSGLTNSIYFWRDPTHIRPINPEALAATLKAVGFKVWDTRDFSPHLSPERQASLEQALGDKDLVRTLYGKQDFVFVCQKI